MKFERPFHSDLRDGFLDRFGTSPRVAGSAPGRVNLIGEHTDYNDGFVLPCAIDYFTCIAARSRDDSMLSVTALDYNGAQAEIDLSEPMTRDPETPWADYVRGVVQVLQGDGHTLSGTDLVISGDVPQGAGLSSSASLEVALGRVFSDLNNLNLSQV